MDLLAPMVRFFINLDPLTADVRQLQARRDRLVKTLRDLGYDLHARVLPGSPGYFRLSLTATDEMIERSLPGFARAMERARGASPR